MGGTTLVTKGILGPIEGDLLERQTELPLNVDAQVIEHTLEMPEQVSVQAGLPNALSADIELYELDVLIEVPKLDINMELEE